ncbi:MAG TPA: TRAP transporter large permease [Thermodesulfobacteriota bacterium]|nr:TRAP transporter large permease [Thermodesulfobacteriota bacterium]
MLTTLCTLGGLLLLLNVPMFVLMVATSAVIIWAYDVAPLMLIATQMFGSIDKFALMAIPFFIFGASIMGAGGLTTRLIAWVEAMVGWVRGGLAYTTILTCEIFGTVSGSSAATTAAVGSILYPSLVKRRYGEVFSLGLVTCTGAIASVIPPSIGMIVYSAITGASVGAVFMGGVGPGILLGICFAGWVAAHTRREKVPQMGSFDFRLVRQRTQSAGWALGMPLLILGGIYSGVFTPTEASAISTIYAMFVAFFIYKEMTLKKLFQIAIESGLITAKIMIIIASSGVFVWILTVGGVPDMVNNWVQSVGASQFLVLLLINVVFLIAGMFLEPNSTLVVLTPLFYPIATRLGVDPVHLGVILVLNISIGMYTPPFGFNLFVSMSIFNAPMRKIIAGLTPFIIVSLLALFITTYVPQITLWLPKILYPKSFP